jgi:hypothetical protein
MAKGRGSDTLSNGDLLEAAERAGFFDVIVTADKNMRYQQNLEVARSPVWSLALRDGRL